MAVRVCFSAFCPDRGERPYLAEECSALPLWDRADAFLKRGRKTYLKKYEQKKRR